MDTLSMLLREGGPIMPLILLAALAGYVLTCERLLVWSWWHYNDRRFFRAGDAAGLEALTREAAAPTRGLERLLACGQARPTPLGWLLGRALALRGRPAAQREQALQADVLARMAEVEARITTIGWLGTILPMLGLLGTVSGMITTFQDLAVTTSRQVLSEGLSEALWTTEVGLIGALPLLAAHHVLTRLKARWLTHLERALALLLAAAATPGEQGQQAGLPPAPHREGGDEA